jgi:hypothetical protein
MGEPKAKEREGMNQLIPEWGRWLHRLVSGLQLLAHYVNGPLVPNTQGAKI